MKINQISIIMLLSLSYHIHIKSFFDDESENNFITQIEAINKNIQKYLKILSQDSQITQSTEKNKIYEQSSRSLSFSNEEKIITIIEQKDRFHKFYTIESTDKLINKRDVDFLKNNPIKNLKDLQSYIQNNFTAITAEKIIDNCIKIIEEHHDNKELMDVEIAEEANDTKYMITIKYQQKKEDDKQNNNKSNLDIEIEEDQDTRRKKKKLHHYNPPIGKQ